LVHVAQLYHSAQGKKQESEYSVDCSAHWNTVLRV